MLFKSSLLCGVAMGVLIVGHTQAIAQVVNTINGNTIEGVRIISNYDNSAGEYFAVEESSETVFYADGGAQTYMNNSNNVSISYDTDNNGSGTFSLRSGSDNVLTANNAGNVTMHYSMNTNGINNDNDGITNAGAVSGVTTLAVSGASTQNGINNSNGGITNAGSISGVATLNASGLSTLTGINNQNSGITNAGAVSGVTTLAVSGASTQNGIDNSNGGITNAGAVGGVTTFTASGLATLNGGAVVNDTFSVDSNGLAANGTTFVVNNTAANTISSNGQSTTSVNNNNVTIGHNNGVNNNNIVVGSTQVGSIGANTFNYGTVVNGGMLVEGDLGVNGSIYALNPTANTGINVANNGLAINGSNNTATLLADSNNTANDGRGQITLQEDQASFYVYNQQNGNAHGLAIGQNQTVLSGGTQTTTLTLNDGGATFHNTISGGAARVTGVADGKADYDAVNFRQLRTVNAGVASVSAMANIPAPPAGKRFSLGLGYGNFQNENAVAVGGVAAITENVSLKAGVGHSNGSNTVGAGVGFSW